MSNIESSRIFVYERVQKWYHLLMVDVFDKWVIFMILCADDNYYIVWSRNNILYHQLCQRKSEDEERSVFLKKKFSRTITKTIRLQL